MKTQNKYLPVLLFGAIAFGVLLGSILDFPIPKANFSQKNHKAKLNRLIDFIDNEYVDAINTDSIVDLTVTNILDKLDPHSVYVPASEQLAVSESMQGNFVGIGVSFYMYKDSVAVIQPVANSPSEKAGIKAGDRILYANNYKLFGRKLPTDTLFSKLKGEEGSKVALTIYRKSENKTFKINVKRDVVPLKSVDVAVLLNSSLGYIKINRFAETTYDEFKQGLQKLQKQGAKNLVIDLRENGGGYLETAVAIADEFLKNNEIIVVTKNKNKKVDKTLATAGGIFETGKVAILIDENSASASEILAGAIQDNDRGLIIGRRSFGKGLVQREMNFNDGSAVRLTIARYYTPSGRSIQKPYKKGDSETYFNDFEKRFEAGELYNKDSIKIADTLKFKTKKGKIVFGGGGIVPDVFVPIETQKGQEGLLYLLQSGVVGNFIFEQIDSNRNELKKLNFDQLLSKINKTDLYFNSFEKFLLKNDVDLNLSKNKTIVKRYLSAEFARQLFDEQKYYEILIKQDAMIKMAIAKGF
jgi:carboxyl-terminal processing protease